MGADARLPAGVAVVVGVGLRLRGAALEAHLAAAGATDEAAERVNAFDGLALADVLLETRLHLPEQVAGNDRLVGALDPPAVVNYPACVVRIGQDLAERPAAPAEVAGDAVEAVAALSPLEGFEDLGGLVRLDENPVSGARVARGVEAAGVSALFADEPDRLGDPL